MAAGWLLSGNLPLIITGGDARCSVGLAQTNGKLDFFTELEWGVEIHILTCHQLAVDQDKCFGIVGEGGSKLSVMLRGTLIRFLQSPPGCREDQSDLHLPEQPVRGGQGGSRGGGGELKATELTFFSDDSLLHPCRGPESKCKCWGLWGTRALGYACIDYMKWVRVALFNSRMCFPSMLCDRNYPAFNRRRGLLLMAFISEFTFV